MFILLFTVVGYRLWNLIAGSLAFFLCFVSHICIFIIWVYYSMTLCVSITSYGNARSLIQNNRFFILISRILATSTRIDVNCPFMVNGIVIEFILLFVCLIYMFYSVFNLSIFFLLSTLKIVMGVCATLFSVKTACSPYDTFVLEAVVGLFHTFL